MLSGVRTGRCVTSADNPPNKSCEIYAWCPVEQDALPVYVRCMQAFLVLSVVLLRALMLKLTYSVETATAHV